MQSLKAVHRYLQAAGHLAALPGHLRALLGHLWDLAWVAYLSTWRLAGCLQALAASNNLS